MHEPETSPVKADNIKEDLLKEWLKNKENLLLLIVILFVVSIRIYYFLKLGEQPIWWDEGDYLAIAKIWALNLDKPNWYEHFTGLRPLLMPLVFTAFFKIGLGEMSIRFFTLLIPSIAAVYLTYLIGKSMYSKKVGLIAAVMFGGYWVFLFYTFRILTDIPSVFFGLASIYFFWEYYINRNKPIGLYIAMLFGVLAFSTRFPMALVPVTFVVFLLFIKKLHVFKDRVIWKAAGFTILFLAPYFIYFILNKFYALKFYLVSGATVKQPIDWQVINLFTSLPFTFWQIAFIIGLISMYPLILYFDMIWKQKTNKFNADIFLILFLILHLFFYVVIIREGVDRWLLMLMPAMFIVASKGLEWIYSIIKKYNKITALIVIGVILFGGLYQNLNHAHNLIVIKKDTYLEIKLAGEWLKDNTPPDTRVITSSVVQSEYYSERWNEGHSNKNNRMPPEAGCIDNLGGTNENESCQKLSEELFERSRKEFKPDYFIVSVFEPVFTPKWVYAYPERNNLTAVQVYKFKNEPDKLALVIYKLPEL